jgi:hypothetical protein
MRQNEGDQETPGMNQTGNTADELMKRVLGMLGKTRIEEYSCDDAGEVLDLYVDMTTRGEDAAAAPSRETASRPL